MIDSIDIDAIDEWPFLTKIGDKYKYSPPPAGTDKPFVIIYQDGEFRNVFWRLIEVDGKLYKLMV